MQRVLDEKCRNTYSGSDAVWLCIKAHDPALEVWQMEQLVAYSSVPDYSYEWIYIGVDALTSDGGGSRSYLISENQNKPSEIR